MCFAVRAVGHRLNGFLPRNQKMAGGFAFFVLRHFHIVFMMFGKRALANNLILKLSLAAFPIALAY